MRFVPRDDRWLAAVHPDGQEYLTTPHGNDRLQELARYRFADDRRIQGLASVAAVEPGLRWGHGAGYLANELLLADTRGGGHLLVQRAPMRLLGEVVYPDGQPRTWPVASQQGSWLTRSGQGVQRWVLAHPPG